MRWTKVADPIVATHFIVMKPTVGEDTMRNLSTQEIRLASGAVGLYAAYSPNEISPLSAMVGYLIGSYGKSWKDTNHKSSMNGVINAISLCSRRINVAREVTFHYFSHTRGINSFTHFVCGITMGLTERPPK